MANKVWQLVLSGTGGQGLITAGVTLAKTAIMEQKNAVQTQSYGIQTRGGFSQAEVIISEGTIFFPKCDNPDLVLALSQDSYQRYRNKVSEDCVIIYDQDLVKIENRRSKDIGYPFSAQAIGLGNEKVINSMALGSVLRLCPVVGKDTLAKVLESELPAKVLSLNIKAFDLGYEEILKAYQTNY